MRAVGVGRWLYKAPKPGPSLIDIARHSMRQGLCNGTMSLRPFVCLSRLSSAAAACGRLLPWARWALGQAMSIDGRRAPNSKWEQCHVVSWTHLYFCCVINIWVYLCVSVFGVLNLVFISSMINDSLAEVTWFVLSETQNTYQYLISVSLRRRWFKLDP